MTPPRDDAPATADPGRIDLRRASPADAAVISRLLADFNTEFGDPAPSIAWLTRRIARLLTAGDDEVLLAVTGSSEPVALALLRFRPSLWSDGSECYLAEFYVVPGQRGRGIGRRLLRAVMARARERGADLIDLNTGEDDVAARHLYESEGFDRQNGTRAGPMNFYYERDLTGTPEE